MEYRILGRTGLKVGAIALGCEGFADKTAEEVRADFDFAIRNGINFLDLYASNPELRSNIGAALAGRREKFVIQGHLCSVWEGGQYLRTRDPEKSLAAFEDLLARLGTDYVEIGMIHYVDAEADLREVLDGPIMRLAQRLRSEGRIRHIGLSSHNPVVAHMAARTGLIDVLMFSVNPCYDLLPPSDDVDTLWADESYARELHNIDPERQRLYEFCEREGIAIDVMKDSPWKNVQEMIVDVKAHPGKYTMALPGTGGTAHIATLHFLKLAGIPVNAFRPAAAAAPRSKRHWPGVRPRPRNATTRGRWPGWTNSRGKGTACTAGTAPRVRWGSTSPV